MKNRILVMILGAAALVCPALAQSTPSPSPSPWPLPAPVAKELASRASNVTDETLGKDKDQAAASQLVEGLDGIYVRDYEFDKEGQYSMDDVEKLRQVFETPEWTPIVRTREHNGTEITDVLMKQVNGETRGMFVLSVEPKELCIVLILGPIRMDQLGMLKGLGGLGALGNVVQNDNHSKHKSDQKPADGGQQ